MRESAVLVAFAVIGLVAAMAIGAHWAPPRTCPDVPGSVVSLLYC
jgi:hypothetical protein